MADYVAAKNIVESNYGKQHPVYSEILAALNGTKLKLKTFN